MRWKRQFSLDFALEHSQTVSLGWSQTTFKMSNSATLQDWHRYHVFLKHCGTHDTLDCWRFSMMALDNARRSLSASSVFLLAEKFHWFKNIWQPILTTTFRAWCISKLLLSAVYSTCRFWKHHFFWWITLRSNAFYCSKLFSNFRNMPKMTIICEMFATEAYSLTKSTKIFNETVLLAIPFGPSSLYFIPVEHIFEIITYKIRELCFLLKS